MLKEDGFLGTDATLGADLNLLAYLLLLVPLMLIGFYFARGKKFRNHKYVMTIIMLSNWVLIALIMAASFGDNVSPGIPERLEDSFFLSPTLHAAIALTAQVIASYLVIRMWFEKRLPSWILIRNFKPWMRLTLVMWLTAATLGIITYALWYLDEEAIAEIRENEVSLQNFAFNPQNLTVEVGTKVTWINNETMPHTVTFDDGSVDSGELLEGDTFSYTFDEPGTYPIHCEFHGLPGGGMYMTVTVVESLEGVVPAASPVTTEEAVSTEESAPLVTTEESAPPTTTPAPPAATTTPIPPPTTTPVPPPPTATGVATTPQTVEVSLVNQLFAPKILTIAAGTTVIWTNNEARVHTVTFDDGSLDSSELAQGEQFQYTFDTPGTYQLYCRLHGGPGGLGMSMTVRVE